MLKSYLLVEVVSFLFQVEVESNTETTNPVKSLETKENLNYTKANQSPVESLLSTFLALGAKSCIYHKFGAPNHKENFKCVFD